MRRLAALIASVMLAMVTSVGPVGTNSAVFAHLGSLAADATIEPLHSIGGLPPALNAQVSSFNQRISQLSARQAALDARQTALDPRIKAYNEQSRAVLAALDANSEKIKQHNARVAQYPNGAPPAIAAALNAEARELNSEQERLKQQAGQIADEGDAIQAQQRELKGQQQKLDAQRDTLRADRQNLILQMANALAAALNPAPRPDSRRADAGDQARPATIPSRVNGGDSVSGTATGAALSQYAKRHNAKVDLRPVRVVLSPHTVSRLPAAAAGALQPMRTFDGLIKRPDGTYQALYTRPAGQAPTASQKAFDDAINNGGQGTAVVDGKRISVTNVAPVERPSGETAAPKRRDLVLGLDIQEGVRAFAEQRGYEHLMKVPRGALRRELLGRFSSPGYRIHVTLKGFSKTDYGNVLARGEAYENGDLRMFDDKGKLLPHASNWERAPGVTDWEIYLLHTTPGALARTTFYDEDGNPAPNPF